MLLIYKMEKIEHCRTLGNDQYSQSQLSEVGIEEKLSHWTDIEKISTYAFKQSPRYGCTYQDF